MKEYVKKFVEYVNEGFDVAQSKTDEFLEMANGDKEKYEELMRGHLMTLDVESFMDVFSRKAYSVLEEVLSDKIDYEEPYRDSEGDVSGGAQFNGNLGEVIVDMDDDEFGEYGVSYTAEDGDYNVYAFDGELEISDTELGKAMNDTFRKVLELAVRSAEDDVEANENDFREMQNDYKRLANSEGWAY